MATYEYACPDHGPKEFNHPMGQAPEQELCPTCGAWMNRQYTATPTHFRAKGFYKTGG
jgi:putative FmdB family regulatory protein